MKTLSLPIILDGIFVAIASFFISFSIVSFFIQRPYSLVVAGMLGALFCLLAIKYMSKKRFKETLKRAQKKHFDDVITQLNIMTNKELYDFMQQAFLSLNVFTERKKNCLELKGQNKLAVFKFGYFNVSKADIVFAYNLAKNGEQIQIYSENFTSEIISFATQFGGKIILKNSFDTYDLLKKANTYPEIKFTFTKSKQTFTEIKLNLFNKKRAKAYLGFGVMFLLFSYFVPIRWYYLISGGTMLVMSIICVLFGKREKRTAIV